MALSSLTSFQVEKRPHNTFAEKVWDFSKTEERVQVAHMEQVREVENERERETERERLNEFIIETLPEIGL